MTTFTTPLKVTFHAESDIVVIDTDPEMADMSNPRGEIYGYLAACVAVFSDGSTKHTTVKVARYEADAMKPAEAMAAALTKRLEVLGRLPVGFEAWEAGRAIYGTDAWTRYGENEQIEFERREDGRRF